VKAAGIAGVLALLAGCAPAIPPLPAAASISPPANWRTTVVPQAPIDAEWWRRFGDPTLNALIASALANNTDIAIAAVRVREARAQESLARSQLLPTLDLGGGITRQRSPSPFGTPTESTVVEPLFQAAYEVDLFGRIANQAEAARQSTLASQAARDTVVLSVSAATASGYITLLALDARLAVVRATLQSRAEALRIAGNRARVGYTSDLELRQAQAEYEATAQLVPQVQLAITRQENALSVLIGVAPQTIRRGLPFAGLQLPPVPQVLPSELLRRRPDIAQAEFTLAASQGSLAAARAQFLPQVRLSATAGALATGALADPITIWSIGGSVLAPIFNAGRNRAQFDTAAARREQSAFAYRRTVLNAFREVEDNLASVLRQREQLAATERQRAALASALAHARNRYEAGYSPYLEQLDAQRALLTAELSLIQVRTDELNAIVALYQAAGGGWPAPPVGSTAADAF
jgi:multidrug efflux system outer membrane protein